MRSISANFPHILLILIQCNFWKPVYLARLNGKSIQFANSLINIHFGECNAIKIWKDGSETFSTGGLTVPTNLVNLQTSTYRGAFKHLNQTFRPHHSLIAKHNRQCLLYIFSLNGFEKPDLNYVYSLFKLRALKIQSTFSYFIISEFNDLALAEKFTLSTELNIYPHRILIGQTTANPETVWMKRFCFFCSNSEAGFFPDLTQYKSPMQFKDISEIFPDVIRNFNGKVMRITGPLAPPLVLISPSRSNPSKNDIQGQQANIVLSIAHHFNFTTLLHTSPGGSTGIKLSNGTWTGIIGEILYGTADIGVSVASSYERYQVVDATVSVFYAFLVLVSTKPKPVFEWQAIFYPFKRTCWLAFIASTLFTFFASKWLHNNAIKYEVPASLKGIGKPQDIIDKMKKEFMTNYKSFYITVGQLLEQGTPFDFNTTPSRMYVLFWMFFAMIITTAYRSKLFTFLTFPHIEVPPNNFLELSKSSYKYGMKHLGGIAFVFITKSPLSYIRSVGEKMAVYNDKYSCLDRTYRDRFTCIIYKAYIDYVAEVRYWKVRHQLHISDFVTPPVGSSWVLPKYAPWLPAFDRICSAIYEMNLADKYLLDYQVKVAKVLRAKAKQSNSTQDKFDINDNFKGDEDEGPKPLVMANLYAAFFISLFGVTVASSILLMEVLRMHSVKKKLKRKQQHLKIHLRRKIKNRKRQLPVGAPTKLSLQEVVRVIMPNSSDIIELSREHPLK